MVRRYAWLAVALATGLGAAQMASAKLVGAWLFDEKSGASVKDASGGGSAGTIQGGVAWEAAGKFGSALKFDGKSGQVDVPDPTNKLTPKKMTLAAWVKLDSVAGTKSIAEQYDWAGNFGTHAFRVDGDKLTLWVIWGPGGDNASGGALKAGEWMHVAGSYDGQTARTFINGKMVAEKKLAAVKDLVGSSKSLSIGVRGDTKDVHWMAGVIDEVAVYDEALTEAALAGVMNGLAASGTAVDPKGKTAAMWAQLKETHR